MPVDQDRYKWVALSNTTLGVLLATIDGSIVLIAMPDIFRGIGLDPLKPGNSFYLLWMILGFLVVSSVLVVSLGRLGDLYGRVRMYNVGFIIYTLASLLLTIDWMHGRAGADWLIGFRIVQGIGAAFLIANSVAILTDAFPAHQRGLALGINNVAGIGVPFDQARRLELGERLCHRLRPDSFRRREGARGLGALAVEAAEHARLRDRKRVLRPQPPEQLAEHQAELARTSHDLRGRLGHAEILDR